MVGVFEWSSLRFLCVLCVSALSSIPIGTVSSCPRPLNPMRLGKAYRLRIAGVGVADHAQAGVAGEDSFQPAIHLRGAVGHHYHARVLRVTDADAAAVVYADPTGAGCGV